MGLYEKWIPSNLTWLEKLTVANEAGFDYIEISIDESDEKLRRLEYTKEVRLALKKAIHDTGVPIYSMCLSGHRKYPLGSRDPKIRTKGLSIMKKAIDLAADLKKACRMAALKVVILAFETMETNFYGYRRKIHVLCEASK